MGDGGWYLYCQGDFNPVTVVGGQVGSRLAAGDLARLSSQCGADRVARSLGAAASWLETHLSSLFEADHVLVRLALFDK